MEQIEEFCFHLMNSAGPIGSRSARPKENREAATPPLDAE